MTVTVDAKGFDTLTKSFDSMGLNLTKSMQKNIEGSTIGMHGDMVKSIQKRSPNSGPKKRYTKGGPKGRTVYPAKAGSAPNTDNGNLVTSIKFDIGTLKGEAGTSGVVRNGYDYALGLEKTHPYIAPAFKKWERIYEQRMNMTMQQQLKGG